MGRPRLEGERKAPARHRHVSQPKVRIFVPRRGTWWPRPERAKFCAAWEGCTHWPGLKVRGFVIPWFLTLRGEPKARAFVPSPACFPGLASAGTVALRRLAYPLPHRNSHFGYEADAAMAGGTKVRTLTCALVQEAVHALVYPFLEQDRAAQKFALWAAHVAGAPSVALVSCERTASAAQSNAGSCLLPHWLTDL